MLQRRNVLHLLACLALTGCSSAAQVSAVGEDAASSFAGPGPQRGAGNAYVLGPGDRLRIKVYSEPDLTGEYEVDSAGFISLPLVGQIRASGSTTSQLERTIVAKMKGQISQDPKVNVEIAAYAPFYIFGEVRKAGEYPYRPGLTVADAVATAGGLTYRANENKIYVRRAGSSVEEMVSLAMRVRVYPGDNIRVDERYF
ncbi:polysaccharide export protein [Microbacteriaceae bacterium K1510]|nr:polysaccharide export protein [Microbacteriaceae bacterium K1510]